MAYPALLARGLSTEWINACEHRCQYSTFKVTVEFVASIGTVRGILFNETRLEGLLGKMRAEQFVGEEEVGELAKKLSAKNRVWMSSAILHAGNANG